MDAEMVEAWAVRWPDGDVTHLVAPCRVPVEWWKQQVREHYPEGCVLVRRTATWSGWVEV